MWNPFKRTDDTARRLKAVQAELLAIRQRKELAAAEAALAAIKEDETYATADSSARARIDIEREMRQEQITRQIGVPQTKPKPRRMVSLAPEGITFLTAAKQSSGISCTEEIVRRHATESILEAVNGTPFGFDLIAEYRNLLQIPTLIRELWPYKPTIIRTLPMLDFARWICRVVYEECLTAKGLVKGKTNYICRGMTAKVIDLDGGKADDQAAKDAQRVIDKFLDTRNYMALRCERYRRKMIEGEAFMWLTPVRDDVPEACFVEPDFIRPSQRESRNQEDPSLGGGGANDPDWSFGIRTPHHKYWQPLEFQIVWNDNEEEKVDAADMFHSAVRERSNIKRCLPPMFAEADDLVRLTLLRAALAEASKFRASIGGVVKYEMASQGSISNWEDTIRRGGLSQALAGESYIRAQEVENSTNLIELPPGRDFVNGPDWPDVGCLQTLYDWHENAIAQAEQVPSWMVSGATKEASFAASLTSESPSILEFEAEAEKESAVDRLVLRRVLQMEIERNRIDKDFFEKYDVRVEGKSMIARDAKGETDAAKIATEAGFCSVETASTQLGFNYAVERPIIEAEKAAGIGPRWQADPNEANGPNEAGSPETAGGEMQRLQGPEEKEFDESKHPRADDGTFGSGGAGEADSGDSADSDDEPTKRPAIPKGPSVSAKREGKGKDAKIVMSDGSEPPAHITPGMIPPAWENVQVFTDPDSEIWAKGTMTGKNGKIAGKTVYKPSYESEMAAAKFTRINVMKSEIKEIDAKIQADRANPKTKDAADAALLMREQATRPGSEADTKGMAKHYGKPVTADDVVVTAPKGKGASKVALKIGDETIPVKDQGTADEIQRRIAAGESLEDSSYWLKSHGATTLEGRHVVESPDGVRLQFVGKEGVWHDHLVENPETAKMLLERKNAAGDKGKLLGVIDTKVSEYVKTLDHGRLSPKDLRTNKANEIAAAEVQKFEGPPKDEAEAKARKIQVATAVSQKLGNRPQQCIDSYIDPAVWSHESISGAA